jgi:hypothetical protein
MKRLFITIFLMALCSGAAAFDHAYSTWDDLLKKHVRYIENGNASRVSYSGFLKDRGQLKGFLDEVQGVKRGEFDAWSKPQQEAFLINAYNGFTVEKILTRYPEIKSIRDFGTLFGNPWKDKFFTLFGQPAYLDLLEHEMLRKEGVYDEPRVHVAVVCASIGCPMLRNEPYLPATLDAQLEDSFRRFLSDRTRNRYNAQKRTLEVSKIFDWYGKDFEKGYRGFTSVKATLAKYAELLADAPADQDVVRQQKAEIAFLDYDWGLNDAR